MRTSLKIQVFAAMAALAMCLCVCTPADAVIVTYAYDNAGRLSKADFGGGRVIFYTYDNAGNILKREATPGGSDIKGDANGDTRVDLTDIITVLKVLAGLNINVNPKADVNGDGKIGFAEGLYVLQVSAGLRN